MMLGHASDVVVSTDCISWLWHGDVLSNTLSHEPYSPPLQVEDLARLSFKRKPLYVGIDDSKAVSTREGLEQGYCVVPSAQRFLLLFTFLKKNLQKKVLHTSPVDCKHRRLS